MSADIKARLFSSCEEEPVLSTQEYENLILSTIPILKATKGHPISIILDNNTASCLGIHLEYISHGKESLYLKIPDEDKNMDNTEPLP